MRKPAWYLLAGLLASGLLVAAGPAGAAAAATPGSLDTSFGTGGKVLTDLGVGGGAVTDAVLQPNGDIVVSGGFGLARYLPGGQLDQTFGTGGGKVLTGTGNGPFTALGLDAAGDIFTLPALTEFSPSPSASRRTTPPATSSSRWPATTPS